MITFSAAARSCASTIVSIAMLLPAPRCAHSQATTDSARISELERQVDVITRELERIALGNEVVDANLPTFGFAPAASKVYQIRDGVSIGGYGEFLYESFSSKRDDGSPSGKSAKLDALRGILYVGFKFNDQILFNSEIEVEHGSTGQAGSTSLEFAYLDYRMSDRFGVRAGLLLVPMGLVNELHEPPIFLGSERSITENRIIPSTWRETGIGVFGETRRWSYRAYLVNSLDGVGGGSSKAKGFSNQGLRGGRQKGSKALAEDFSVVGRVDYQGVPNLQVGVSGYYGRSGHGRRTLDDRPVDVPTGLWDAHVRYLGHGWDAQGVFARATLSGVSELNELKGFGGDESVGEAMSGWYVQAGYDVLWKSSSEHQLLPYVRYEAVNTQIEVPTGFAANPANDLDVLSLGLAWKPIGNAVLKLDYQMHGNAASTGVDQLNVALGYLF